MEKRKFVIFGVLASVVALLAFMMFAIVTFASDEDANKTDTSNGMTITIDLSGSTAKDFKFSLSQNPSYAG